MKILKFKSNLAKLILEGNKTTTWRLFDDKDLQVGDKLILQNSETGENFANAEIAELYEKKLSGIIDLDYDGHEKFANQEEMISTYRKYYGDKVNLDTLVKIIKFRLI